MVLMNPIAFRLNYTHLWKYRNIITFDKNSFANLVRESYFLPHYLARLFERRVFRRFECYLSHMVVHRFNNGLTYYNIFISSRLFAGMAKWFRRVFMGKFFYLIRYDRRVGKLKVQGLLNKHIKLLKSINYTSKKMKYKYNIRSKLKDGIYTEELMKRYLRKLQYKAVPLIRIINVISKFTLFFAKLYVSVLRIINSSFNSLKMAIKAYSNYKNERTVVRLFTLNGFSPTADSLGSIFLHRLRRGSSINRLVSSTLERVKKKQYRYVQGMRIVCEGRFKRRQRAQHDVYNVGKVKTSTISAKVDYGLTTVYLKYGAASVRIWLNYV
jgi:hypothetical protein